MTRRHDGRQTTKRKAQPGRMALAGQACKTVISKTERATLDHSPGCRISHGTAVSVRDPICGLYENRLVFVCFLVSICMCSPPEQEHVVRACKCKPWEARDVIATVILCLCYGAQVLLPGAGRSISRKEVGRPGQNVGKGRSRKGKNHSKRFDATL